MSFLNLDSNYDFPFYRENPKLSKKSWALLLASVAVGIIVYLIFGNINELLGDIVLCFSLLIPLLYVSGWNYTLYFRKPTRDEVLFSILLTIGYLIYSMILTPVLISNNPASSDITWISLISLIFLMMGEELFKFILLMFFMRIIYKYSNNRMLAIVMSAIITLFIFGLCHAIGVPLIAAIIIPGFGSIFMLYGYLKTKNIWVSYLSHIITDGSIMLLILIGIFS